MSEKGIIIDIGFKGDIDGYIKEIQKQLESTDFGKSIGLTDSFKKQAEDVRNELGKLSKEIDEAIGKQNNKALEERFKTLSKTVGSLAVTVSNMTKNMPDFEDTGISELINDTKELGKIADNAASALNDIAKVAKGNVKFVDSNQKKELEDIYKILTKALRKSEEIGTTKKKVGNTPYSDWDDTLNDIIANYDLFQEITEKIENIDFINPNSQKELDKLNASLLNVITTLSRTIATFSNKGGKLDFVIPELSIPIYNIEEEIDSYIDEVKAYISKRQAEIQNAYSMIGGGDLNDLLVQSKAKNEKIKIPVALDDGSRGKLRKDTIDLIEAVQSDISKHPLEIEVSLISRNQNRGNLKLIEDINKKIKELDDNGITEITDDLQKLINKMNKQVDNAMIFNVEVTTERAINSVRRFVSQAKEELKALKEDYITIEPDIELSDKVKNKFKEQIKEAQGNFEITLNVDEKEIKHEKELLEKLRDAITEVKDAINLKTEAFIDEDSVVQDVIKDERESLNGLYADLLLISDELENISKDFKNITFNKNYNVDDNFLNYLSELNTLLKDISLNIKSGFSNPEVQIPQLVDDRIPKHNIVDIKAEEIAALDDTIEKESQIVEIQKDIIKTSNWKELFSNIEFDKYGNLKEGIENLQKILSFLDEYKRLASNQGKHIDLFNFAQGQRKNGEKISKKAVSDMIEYSKYSFYQLDYAKKLADNGEIEIKKNGIPKKKDIGRFISAWQTEGKQQYVNKEITNELDKQNDLIIEQNKNLTKQKEVKKEIEKLQIPNLIDDRIPNSNEGSFTKLNSLYSNIRTKKDSTFSESKKNIENINKFLEYYIELAKEAGKEGPDLEKFANKYDVSKENLSLLQKYYDKLVDVSKIEIPQLTDESLVPSPAVETNKEIEQSANAAAQAEENLAKAEKQANENGLSSGWTRQEDGNFVDNLTGEIHAFDETTTAIIEEQKAMGELQMAFRGLTDSMDGFMSTTDRQMTFFTTSPYLAREYANELGGVYQANVALGKSLYINGQGRDWNAIEYLGDGSDKASQKIIALRQQIEKLQDELNSTQGVNTGLDGRVELNRGDYSYMIQMYGAMGAEYESYIEAVEKGNLIELQEDKTIQKLMIDLYEAEKAYRAISDSKDNIYGTHTTNEFGELAKNLGYSSVIFENIKDSFDYLSRLTTVGIIFDENQVDNAKIVNEQLDQLINKLDKISGTGYNLPKYQPNKSDISPAADTLPQQIEETEKFTAATENLRVEEEKLHEEQKSQESLILSLPSLIDEGELQDLTKEEKLLEEINSLWSQISSNRTGKTNRSAINEKEEIENLTLLAQKLHELKDVGGKVNFDYTNKKDKDLITKYYNAQNVPSQSDSLGNDAVDGYKLGLLEKEPEVIAAVEKVVEAGIQAAKKAQDSNSPSEKYRKLGNDAMDGYIKGIEEKTKDVQAAIKNVFEAGFVSIKTDEKEISRLSELLKTLKSTLTALGSDKSETKVQKLSDNLNKISQSLSQLNIQDSPVLKELNEILKKGTDIANLAKAVSGINSGKVNSSSSIDKEEFTKNSITNNETANYYNKLTTDAKKYWQLKEKVSNSQATEAEINELKRLDDEYDKLTGDIKNYNIELNATAQSISRVTQAQNDFKYKVEQGGAGYKDYIIGIGNTFTKVRDKLELMSTSSRFTSGFQSELANLYGEYKSFIDNISNLSSNDLFSNINKLTSAYTELINKTKDSGNKDIFSSSIISVQKYATSIQRVLTDNSAMSKELRNNFEKLYATTQSLLNAGEISKQQASEIALSYQKLSEQLELAGDKGKSFFDKIKDSILTRNTQFIAQYFGFQDFIRYGQQMFETIKSVDSALTELRKVSNASDLRLAESFEASAKTAKEFGATINEVIYSTSDWARLGYSVDQAEELARVTTLYQNVGDNIEQAAASESLVSTMQGFQLAYTDAESIIDKFNEVANNFAIDSAGIGEALKRSAASFNAANTDLSKSIALITATNEVVQDPDVVGTLWKTLSARIRGADVELKELGEDTDEYTKSTSKLRDLVKGMTGFDIMLDENNFKDIYEIILGIGKEWNNLSDIDQAALGEALAGKRNANALYAVLGNLDTLQDAYETAENSAGSAMAEQQNYEKSIQYSVEKVKASIQEWSADLVDSSVIKWFVDLASAIIQVSDAIGPLTTLLGAGGIVAAFKNFGKPKSWFQNKNVLKLPSDTRVLMVSHEFSYV